MASKFTPIAPAPAKISWTNPHQVTATAAAQQPAQMSIMFQHQPNSNLPILTPGPNGTMILVSPNTFAFPQPTQFILPAAQFQQQVTQPPFLYGIQPTFLQPQVQTTFITQQQLSSLATNSANNQNNSAAEEITIISSSQQQQGVPMQNHQQQQQGVSMQINTESHNKQPQPTMKKFDILERAILEIANLDEETKHQ